jgi:hypothetical protein
MLSQNSRLEWRERHVVSSDPAAGWSLALAPSPLEPLPTAGHKRRLRDRILRVAPVPAPTLELKEAV